MNIYILSGVFLAMTYVQLGSTVLQIKSESDACKILSGQYPTQTFWPNTTEYVNETAKFWSKTTVLSPYCVYSPHSPQDVARALSTMRSTRTKFAVRSGGHMTVKGAASIDDGVLMVMSGMKTLAISSDLSVASVGPGNTWFDVYTWINEYGRIVSGGRYSPVGVSGFLLGGGINFWANQYGWGANNVVNFQLVTADSQIINANASSNRELFWALKGGSNNFGIVTRFDLKTHPAPQVYVGIVQYNKSYIQEVAHALEDWVTPGGGVDDIYAAILPNIQIIPSTGDVQATCFLFRDGVSADPGPGNGSIPSTLRSFTEIPSVSDTVSKRNFSEFGAETVFYGDRSGREAFHCTGLKASAEAVRIVNETVTNAALAELKTVQGCSVSMSLQPISRKWLKAAQDAGGDAISLDPADGSLIELNLVLQWANAADDDLVASWSEKTLAAVDEKSKASGIYYPFCYLNDAATGEEVFNYYGKGSSLPKMKTIRRQYDPDGVFQSLQPGGFKIGI